MRCGFYEMEITPPLGGIIPGSFAARYSTEILDRLFVRATVMERDGKEVALAVVDACGITLDVTERIRQRIASFLPLAPQDIMVMATHTHGGGPTLNWGEEVVQDPAYLDFLVQRVADSIVMAHQKAQESELYFAQKDVYGISFVRIYELKNGGLKTNPSQTMREEVVRPYTEIDPNLFVLAVKQNGKFVGAVLNFATHPATVATRQITGDYISALCKEMKHQWGEEFITVFINGACGNINHINYLNPNPRIPGRHIIVGETLAAAATELMGKAEKMEVETVGSSMKEITVRYRKPTPEALLEAQEHFRSLGDDLVKSVPSCKGYRNTFFALQALQLMADKNTTRSLQLQLLRVGDCYFAGTPTQMFNEYGKKIKAAARGTVFVSAFANDYCGYVPVPECMRPGVYEATLCRTSCLAPETGDLVVEGILSLQKEILGEE